MKTLENMTQKEIADRNYLWCDCSYHGYYHVHAGLTCRDVAYDFDEWRYDPKTLSFKCTISGDVMSSGKRED